MSQWREERQVRSQLEIADACSKELLHYRWLTFPSRRTTPEEHSARLSLNTAKEPGPQYTSFSGIL